jgi:hypothetical protein
MGSLVSLLSALAFTDGNHNLYGGLAVRSLVFGPLPSSVVALKARQEDRHDVEEQSPGAGDLIHHE